jgi:uncharacterized membrane protein YcaP (DUF421 family)
MRREFVSEEEPMSHIHQKGLDDLAQVRFTYLEGDGPNSVLSNEQSHPPPERKTT